MSTIRDYRKTMTEEAWQAVVLDVARQYGWMPHYMPDKVMKIVYSQWRRQGHGSTKLAPSGFPDLVLLKPPRVIFAELKSETGTVRDSQKAWIEGLRQAGQEVYVWRPRDYDEVVDVLCAGGIEDESSMHP